ncbi:3359_t:CDS:2 [Acaulospora morrowiae]|uniref:3359_t:CDS:1 n=1 Tax=Acaulospora morrowiae TaxID=94023 RepID=A0A9N8VBI2_9GLOM|nr:3359_t:CDS:2 [Acaulospora morrowiae]
MTTTFLNNPKHVLHFECIDNERRLCPQCPSIDDQGYYVTPSIPARESNQKKRKKNYESDSKSRSNRGTKPQEIIQELSVDNQIPDSRELLPISVPSENTNTEKKTDQLNHLYYEIDTCIFSLKYQGQDLGNIKNWYWSPASRPKT